MTEKEILRNQKWRLGFIRHAGEILTKYDLSPIMLLTAALWSGKRTLLNAQMAVFVRYFGVSLRHFSN